MYTGSGPSGQGLASESASGPAPGIASSAALLQDFINTPGAYVRDTFKQNQNVIDATKMFGDLQFGIGNIEAPTDGVLIGEYTAPQLEWFNYVLARHRSFQ